MLYYLGHVTTVAIHAAASALTNVMAALGYWPMRLHRQPIGNRERPMSEAEDGRPTSCGEAFVSCSQSIADGVLIERVSRQDKEFHFQNWVESRLADAGLHYDQNGRNSYPDFTLVDFPEGYEVKGLAWPGREANLDTNSRVPSGQHNGRTVFYVFGRYPAKIDEDSYPVVDLVICHGDFLNADHDYVHKNRSFRGFGSYGDLLVRDRKMYVAPTPFALTEGTTGQHTLIVPAGYTIEDARIDAVGDIVRSRGRQSGRRILVRPRE